MSALVVPIDVEALVVDPPKAAQPFRRWRFNYPALASYGSPEPEPGGGQETTGPPPLGVYLHWTLPAALRHGIQDVQTNAIGFPLVPNRWLVARSSGNPRQATGWVVESDCPDPDSSTLYLVDQSVLDAWLNGDDAVRREAAQAIQADLPVATIGKAFPLEGWTERAPAATFLTAVAPGNAAFSAYQPHSANVFGFYDDLEGLDQDTLSYLVVGWHSQPTDDVLHTGGDLTRLGWTADGETTTDATQTLYQGMAFDVPWDRAATTPRPSPLDDMRDTVHVALGNTTVDAFTALVQRQLTDSGKAADATTTDVFQAFQYGLLPELEQVNGQELLRLAVHDAAFGSKAGGYRWAIVPLEGDGSAAPDLSPTEAAWLLQLNADQAALDAAVLELESLQNALYGLWWKWQKGDYLSEIVPIDGFDDTAYETAVRETLPSLITGAAQRVATAAAHVPQPVPDPTDESRQQALDRGIAAFAATKGLSGDKQLKAIPAPRLWRAADPVVVLSGIDPAPMPEASVPLACRSLDDVVSAFTGAGSVDAGALGARLPSLPDAGDVPAGATSLLVEAFLLDPANAAAIAAAAGADETGVEAAIEAHAPGSYRGTLPDGPLGAWSAQPWTPLYMEWEVGYVHIPYDTGGVANWTFDGSDYRYSGPFGPFAADEDPDAGRRPIGGICPLSTEAQFTFGARLKQFVDTFVRAQPDPPAELAELERLADDVAGWRFMSQTLTGFTDLVAMRDARAQTAPDASVSTHVAGQTDTVPYIPNGPTYTFEGARMGQMAVDLLLVYDRFGQVLQVVGGTGVTDPLTFAPTLDPALVPDRPVISKDPARLVQIGPRLAQHARLDFDLVDAHDESLAYGTGAGANPVGGWLLPNHLDRSLLLYSPEGAALGELRLVAGADGTKTARWGPPPGSSMTEADLAGPAPLVSAVVTDDAIRDPAAFQTFLDAIDATLWTIDPLGDRADQNLSVLIGRPLALVRVRLQLTLDGHPIANMTDWEITWPPPPPEFTGYDFAIRLGDEALRRDGVIGYFSDDTYSLFNSVQPPDTETAQQYLRQIGPLGQAAPGNYLRLRFDGNAAYATLLVDPRASIHAVTGILPTKELSLPPALVDRPLLQLALAFQTGPLLTPLLASPGRGDSQPVHQLAVSLPLPAEQGGTWSWWEDAAGGGVTYDLVAATPDAQLKDLPSTLRDGFLQLAIRLGQSAPSNDRRSE